MKEYAPIIENCLTEVMNKGEQGLITILNCNEPRKIMLTEYNRLCLKIETLPKSQKDELWDFVTEKFPTIPKYEKIEYCKVVHCIGYLLP